MSIENVVHFEQPSDQPDVYASSKIALFPLLIAWTICIAVTIFPRFLVDGQGHADHAAASALFWAMSAGFIRGVGFIPRTRILRWLFSTASCVLGLLITLYLMLH
ncbi:cyd operon YbgE family protein [Aquirhabdus parva]|uniref:Cyd operon protein YbgE n=1 Tax=Aquirhabdus parva TaxID=2283318 RepID=A0A345P9W1_9GAMM|nr:cyd operon YbgE family protein [Aquirhabdus parva]AXI04070.1 hypothetical protein HYN46_15215 [Aquirhabdus parva]